MDKVEKSIAWCSDQLLTNYKEKNVGFKVIDLHNFLYITSKFSFQHCLGPSVSEHANNILSMIVVRGRARAQYGTGFLQKCPWQANNTYHWFMWKEFFKERTWYKNWVESIWLALLVQSYTGVVNRFLMSWQAASQKLTISSVQKNYTRKTHVKTFLLSIWTHLVGNIHSLIGAVWKDLHCSQQWFWVIHCLINKR